MGLKYLLDSTLLIDHFNQIKPAKDFLMEHFEDCAISVITLAEVLARPHELEKTLEEDLLGQLPVLSADETDARLAAGFRRSHKLKLPDAFQAAMARRHKLLLVTRNTRDFDPKKMDFVHVPYKV